MPKVAVPGYDSPVDFPDSMSTKDIEKILQSQAGGFQKPKAAASTESVSEKASKNLKKIPLQAEQMKAREDSDAAKESEFHLRRALTMTKVAAGAAPFALAAPFTAGASLPAGAAMMGAAGLGSGVAREGVDLASGEKPKSLPELAKSLAIDTIVGAGTEVGFGVAAKLGGAFLEGQVLRSAQKSQAGMRMVSDLETEATQSVEKLVKGRIADVKGAYAKFVEKLSEIPTASEGAAAKRLSGPPSKGTALGDLAADIKNDLKGDLTQQPMDVLVTMHSRANKLAWGSLADAPRPAIKAAKEFADDLRGVIEKNLQPGEREVFEGAKAITKQVVQMGSAQKIAGLVTRRLFSSVVGGATGLATHSFAAGAAAGVATEAIEQKVAPAILEHLVTSNKMAFQKALTAISDNPEAGNAIIKETAGNLMKSIPNEFRNAIKDMVKKQQPQKPQP